MSNEQAPKNHLYVCLACGKMSEDQYGDKSLNRGWDVSCVMNSKLLHIAQLTIENGRVVAIKEKE